MQFEFSTAHRIVFGEGSLRQLAPAAATLGRRALLVLGKSAERAAPVRQALEDAGIVCAQWHITGEPGVEAVLDGLDAARSFGCDLVVAMGGGSPIDAGKAIAALRANPGEIYDYLEVVGIGRPLSEPSLPLVAIPTTAGTGTEATRNAVLIVKDPGVKVSLRGPWLLPRLAIIDPELTYDLPKEVTAASGLDALAQLIEPLVSIAANPLTDMLCRDGIRRIVRAIRVAYGNGADRQARADMSLAALYSGMAMANAKLGAVHGFAGPIGGLFPGPHGAICARLLPAVLRANLLASRSRESPAGTLSRFDELARLLTGREDSRAEDAVPWLEELCGDLQIPRLGAYGIVPADFPALADRAARSSSMKGNPVKLTNQELVGILEEAI
jgi:alcohol dehydrogenase class IV